MENDVGSQYEDIHASAHVQQMEGWMVVFLGLMQR